MIVAQVVIFTGSKTYTRRYYTSNKVWYQILVYGYSKKVWEHVQFFVFLSWNWFIIFFEFLNKKLLFLRIPRKEKKTFCWSIYFKEGNLHNGRPHGSISFYIVFSVTGKNFTSVHNAVCRLFTRKDMPQLLWKDYRSITFALYIWYF